MAGSTKVRSIRPTRSSRTEGKISAEDLLREFPGSKVTTYEAGAFIFREGTSAKNCYVITQGKVRILKRNKQRKQFPLAVVKAGEFLGEMAMLSGEKRSASAQAVTKVKVIALEHTAFVAHLKARDPFASRLSLQLCTLLAARCHNLLRIIARQPGLVTAEAKEVPPLDVRDVLTRVYTLWAV